jgi:zeaxanthin epoxidase
MKVNPSSIFVLLGAASFAAAFNVLPTVVQPRTSHVSSKFLENSALQMAENQGLASAAAASDAEVYDSLSLPARPGRPLKVAIAGGGVGGLTCALCMLKKGFDVTVYEKTEAFQRFGGPIQFASNALSVLKEIDDNLFDRVMEKFTFTGTRACGIKDGM